MRDGFDNLIKRRLFDYSEAPPDTMWEKIAPLVSSSKSGQLLSARIAGIVVLGVMTCGYYWNSFVPVNINEIQEGPVQPLIIHETTVPSQAKAPSHSPSLSTQPGNSPAKTVSGQKNSLNNGDSQKVEVMVVNPETTTTKSENESVNNAHVNVTNDSHGTDDATLEATEVKQNKDITAAETKPAVPATAATKSKAPETKSTIIPKKKKQSRFGLYMIAMPTFGYQRIESNRSDNLFVQSITRIPAFSSKRLGIRAEAGTEYRLTNRLAFVGSLVYYQRKQTIEYTERVVENTNVRAGPNGEVLLEPEYSFLERSFEYELKNVGVQTAMNVIISKRVFLQTVGTGLEFQFALNKINDAAKAQGFTNNPSAYVFYNLYYRIQYPAASRLRAVVQPMFNYSFYINQDLNAPFYVKPYGLGLHVGCSYNF